MKEVVIIGVGMHEFGHFEDKSFEDLGVIAAKRALKDADVPWKDVQALYVGTAYNHPMAGGRILKKLGPTGIPLVNVEGYCASSMVALWLAHQAVAHEVYDLVLCVGAEKVGRGFLPMEGYPQWFSKLGMAAMPCRSAMDVNRYADIYGIPRTRISRALAKISVKAHKNAALNPYAIYPMPDLTEEEVLNSTMICDPLTMYMMGAPADSGAAAVVCSKEKAQKYGARKPVVIAGICDITTGYTEYGGGEIRLARAASARKVYELSGIGPQDLDIATIHDATAAHELHCYEDFQLCKEGEAVYAVEEGKFELSGKLPTNTDGGFMARGNGPGADALAFIAEAVWQLRGEAGPRQVPNARVGMVFGAGMGSPTIGAAAIVKV